MSRNKQENYLDDLLNSVSRDKTPEEMEMLSLKSQLERMRNGEEEALNSSLRSEDRFLRDFEEELENDNYKDFIEDFEKELSGADNSGMYVNTMDNDPMPEQQMEAEDVISVHNPDVSATQRLQPEGNADLSAFGEIVGEINGEIGDDILDFSIPEEKPLAMTEDGEVDLAGNSSADLVDILSEDSGLADLGDMLSGDGDFHDLSDSDEFGDFAEKEMQQQEQTQKQASEENGKKKKGRKKNKKSEGEKTGFFAKFSKAFFGDDEEPQEADIIVGLDSGSSAAELSDENKRILDEMDSGEDAGKKKKAKKKKAKKEKPKKEKKPKEKKPKKEKPKKEKKPKPVDNTPPLPKGPVILIFLMVISLMVLVLLGTNLTSYQTQVKQAKEYFRTGEYALAYKQLKGRNIKESDEQFFNQLAVLAAVSSEIKNYETFIANDKQEMALDSIVCAAGRYDINYNYAREWECTEELDKLRDKIEKILSEQYKMSFDDALEIYNMKDRGDYSQALLVKLKELGLLSED